VCEGRRNPSIKGGMVIIQGYYTLVGYFFARWSYFGDEFIQGPQDIDSISFG
jgi:hypothetical protein